MAANQRAHSNPFLRFHAGQKKNKYISCHKSCFWRSVSVAVLALVFMSSVCQDEMLVETFFNLKNSAEGI